MVDGGREIGSKSNDKKGTSKKDGTKRIRMGRQCEHTAGGREGGREWEGKKAMRARGIFKEENGNPNGCLLSYLACPPLLAFLLPLLPSFLPSFLCLCFLAPFTFLVVVGGRSVCSCRRFTYNPISPSSSSSSSSSTTTPPPPPPPPPLCVCVSTSPSF